MADGGQRVADDVPDVRPRHWRISPLVAAGAGALVLLIGIAAGIPIGWAIASSSSSNAFPTVVPVTSASPDGDRPAAGGTPGLTPAGPAELIERVELLPLSAEPGAAYDRLAFGQTWADVDRNGCDTRNDVLRRDLLEVEFKADTNGCKVLAGRLIDPYSGNGISFVSGETTSFEVHIDHVVPLAWAWANGANAWTDERRTYFANDPRNLLAVSGAENQAKSASGPASWMPPNRDAHCPYIEMFVSVLLAYELAVPVDDRIVIGTTLRRC